MKALRSPSKSGSDFEHAVRRAAALLPLVLLFTGLPAMAAEVEEPKLAVWKVKEVDFSYRSSVAIYSCKALHDRVATIVRAIGARDDVEVTVSGCDTFVSTPIPTSQDSGSVWGTHSDDPFNRRTDDPFNRRTESLLNRSTDRGQIANIRIRLLMPTEVTPEVIQELDRDKSRRELVSRVTGDPSAKLNVPVAFPAQWQSVTLSHSTIGLDPEECELLEQMSTSVLRPLGVRVVRRGHSCDRSRVSRIPPQLTVEVLVGVSSAPPGGIPQLPPAGAGDPDPSAPAAPEAKPSEPATVTPPE